MARPKFSVFLHLISYDSKQYDLKCMLTTDNIRHVGLSLSQCFSDFLFAQILTFLLDLSELSSFAVKGSLRKLCAINYG